MSRTIVSLLLCLLVVSSCKSVFAAPTTTEEPTITKVVVQHLKAEIVSKRLSELGIGDREQPLIPGIQDVILLSGLNALLVKGEKDAVDRLIALVKRLDQPQKSAIFEGMFVSVKTSWALEHGCKRKDDRTWELPESGDWTTDKEILPKLIACKEAKVIDSPRMVIKNGDSGSLSIKDKERLIGYSVRDVVFQSDEAMTVLVEPVLEGYNFRLASPVTISKPIEMKNGVKKLIAIYADKDPKGDRLVLFFLTPTVLKENSTMFEGMRTLPPLW